MIADTITSAITSPAFPASVRLRIVDSGDNVVTTELRVDSPLPEGSVLVCLHVYNQNTPEDTQRPATYSLTDGPDCSAATAPPRGSAATIQF